MTEAPCTAAIPCARDPRGGFTLIELIVVMVIAGVMLGVAIPYFLKFSDRNALNSASVAVSTMHARAKIMAVQRGRLTRLKMDAAGSKMWIVSTKATGSGVDTIGSVENLNTRFGITFTTTRDSLTFTPRGVGYETSGTTIVLSKGTKKDTLNVTAAGRLVH